MTRSAEYDADGVRRARAQAGLVPPAAPSNVPPDDGIRRRTATNPPPLSFSQERLWILAQLDPASAAYNIPVGVRLRGPLDTSRLESSVDAVVSRHAVLRSAFKSVDGRPVQFTAPAMPLPTPLIDLRDLARTEQEERVRTLAQDEACAVFDLQQGPLLRSTLLRLDAEEHVWLLTMHHIVSDVDSFAIFFREVSAIYAAPEGAEPLPELAIQYGDFAAWQRDHLADARLQKQIAYWKQMLGSELPLLQLPADKPRPEMQTYAGSTNTLHTGDALAAQLKALSRRERSSLYMILLAAFKVWLHRYTHQDDILVGSPIAGRDRLETENLIGYFQNTLVLRTDLSDDPSFREVVQRVRQVALDAYENQELPFARLVEELQPARNPGHSPLFQTMFLFQSAPLANAWRTTLALPGVTPISEVIDSRTARVDLTLGVEDLGDRLGIMLEYNVDLFEDATAACMLDSFVTCLESIARDPEQAISRLCILSEQERHKLLVQWNDTAVAQSEPAQTLDQLLDEAVAATPDALALVCAGVQLSYRELHARANRLAHYLRNRGVGPEVLVGVFLERSVDMVVALLGILKAGGAYLPLDPGNPAPRLAFILADAGAQCVLTQSSLSERLAAGDATVVCLDREASVAAESSQAPTPVATPDSLAFIIYTSGSTGEPKGVAVSHRSVVNFLCAMRDAPGLTPDDVLLAVTTLAFDIAALEIYLPLCTGARVVLATEETAADGRALARELRQARVSVMQATPATWRLLLAAGWEGQPGLTMLCGGEALPRELAEALLSKGGALWNLYGPTETTIWSTRQRVESAPGPVPVGRPIRNTELYVLDEHLQPVPAGVTGELFIGGQGVARGYLNRPRLTAANFIASPFAGSARLYRTGDLVRYGNDAAIRFLGRADHQVKLRGFRIELGEIEAVLGAHAAVREAAVLIRAAQTGVEPHVLDETLVAYVVLSEGHALSTSELRNYVQGRLPAYMVPAAVVTLASLPRTPNGKLDRNALPEAGGVRPQLEEDYVAPGSALESAFAAIWQELLALDRVGIYDNFFALGGHSLLSMQAVARMEEATGVEIHPRELLFQTLGQLAAACEEREAATPQARSFFSALGRRLFNNRRQRP